MASVEQVNAEIQAALNELRPLFTDDCQLTFIMRKPGAPLCYMVVTNDDKDELIATIQRSKD